MVKYRDLVKKTMPPEKLAKDKQCFISHYFLRPIANVISIPLIEINTSPTGVTIFSGLFPIGTFLCYLFWNDFKGVITGWLLMLIWIILDGVDGNLARYNDRCSKWGDLWDTVTGWEAMVVFYYGTGIVAYYNQGKSSLDFIPAFVYVLLGSMSAMNVIFPRLIMHKKARSYGYKENTAEGLNRVNYGALKYIVFNITSINGGASVIFLICYICGFSRECALFYYAITTCILLYSCLYLLKGSESDG